jgi:hypothetical protein
MLIVYVSACLLVAAATLCFYVTQPLLLRAGGRHGGAAADPERLKAHVRALSESFSPRDYKQTENLDACASYIRAEFLSAGGRVSEQPFKAWGKSYRNVVAHFGPETKERVVVGAHYDAAGPYPGADDNASGSAGLLELARLLGGAELPLKVELVAYSLEEPPFFRTEHMGSAFHARALKQEGASVRAMISLEMIGFFSDADDSQHYPVSALSLLYSKKGDFISLVGRTGEGLLVRRVKAAMSGATDLPVRSINAPRSIPGVDYSDHLNYWHEGFPALMVTDTAFYRNPFYHTADDTAEKLDYARMAKVVEGVHAAVLDLSR